MDLWSEVQSQLSAPINKTLVVADLPPSVDADVPEPIVRMTHTIAENLRVVKMLPRLVTRRILVGHRVVTLARAGQAPRILTTLQTREHRGHAEQSQHQLAAVVRLVAAVPDLAAPMTLMTVVALGAVRTLQNHVTKRMEAGHHAVTPDLASPVQSTRTILQMPERHGLADASTTWSCLIMPM